MTEKTKLLSYDSHLLATASAILKRLTGVEEIGPGRWRACCPLHDDQHPSLYITVEDDRVLLHCFAGCKTIDIVRTLGFRMAELFAKNPGSRQRVYKIRDLDGHVVAEHVRIDSPTGKKFWWRRGGRRGLGGLALRELPLYGIEKLRDLPAGSTVVVAEGEKAAEALWNAGVPAVGTVCGAAVTPSPEVLAPLKNFNVVLWADNDDKGIRHMQNVAQVLFSLGITPSWVDWREAPPKGDAADCPQEKIWELIRDAKRLTPPGKLSYPKLLEIFRRWLYLPDDTPLRYVLSLVTGNRLQGDPLWGMLVGPSGSCKTEILNALTGLSFVIPLDALTPKTLLSGKEKQNPNASLLKRLPDGAILLMRDFSTVLAMREEDRAEVFAQLRKVYDGHFSRATGESGELSWTGKVGLICGCTPEIEEARSFMARLGERFLYLRMPPLERERAAIQAIQNREQLKLMRAELSDTVMTFFQGLEIPSHVEIPEELAKRLVKIADFVSLARTPVPRDRHTREIRDKPNPEMPTRLGQQFAQLACGHAVLNGRSVVTEEDVAFVAQVARSCIPQRLSLILTFLRKASRPQPTSAIAAAIGLPTSTVRRDLEDLTALQLVTRIPGSSGKPDSWTLTEEARSGMTHLLETVGNVIPSSTEPSVPANSPKHVEGENQKDPDASYPGFAGTPPKVLFPNGISTVPAIEEEDPSTWPVCSGCDRKVPRVNGRGLCPDCAAVLEGGDK